MSLYRSLSIAAVALTLVEACSDDTVVVEVEDAGGDASIDAGPDGDDDGGLEAKAVLDLAEVAANPDDYEWFDFRPNLKKLILAGAAETEHIAILWYMVDDGGVALHYHGQTESVYVIDGTQTDAKGTYETGTVYFNPPGSGHQVTDSSGFFLLAYAAPPDFMGVDMIEEYTPIKLDTEDPDFIADQAFEEGAEGVQTFAPELDSEGGMSAEFIETSSAEGYDYEGNYVLVLDGSCTIDGESYTQDMLAVTTGVAAEAFVIAAGEDSTCLALAVSF
jgi:hypothetical protein